MPTQPAHHTQTAGAVSSQQPGKTERFTSPLSLVIDGALVIAFFLFMFSVVRTHVQSQNPLFITLWGAGAAACLSAVFWLAIQMFRVVLRAQIAAKK